MPAEGVYIYAMVSEGNNHFQSKPQIIEDGKNWVDRWREPGGSRAVALAVLILASIAAVDALVYATGGTVYVWPYLMFLPVIVAAAVFRVYGGMIAGLIGGFLLGPFMPLEISTGTPQTIFNWVFRLFFLVMVGTLCGLISKFLNEQIRQLKKSKASIQYILNNTKEAIFQMDLEGNYIFGNDAAEQLTGYPLSELLRMNMMQLTALEYRPLVSERLCCNTADGADEKAFEIEIRHKDGHKIWAELTTRKVFNREKELVAIQGVARDITERKKTALAITLFRALIDHANDAIEVIDPQTGRFLDINAKAGKIHGYGREEFLTLTVSQIDPKFATGGEKTWAAHLEALKQFGFLVFETEHRRKDGSIFPVEINASYIHLERDYILAVVRDVSERKTMERNIRQLNRVYAVLSGINELIVREKNLQLLFEGACRIAVEKGKFRLAWLGLLKNPSAPVELLAHAGATPDTLNVLQKVFHDPGLGCMFTKHAIETGSHAVCNDVEHDPEAAPWRQLALERGYLSLVSLPLNVRGQRAGVLNIYAGEKNFFDAGELRLLDELAADISFALEVNQQDVERRQLEEQFRQAQKMEAIGQLASGVAHDFNNILAVIQMQADLLKATCKLSETQTEFADEIASAAQRAAALTRQLLMFSRKQTMQLQELDLNESINNMTKILRRTLGENIQMQFKFAMENLFVQADAGMMDQVLMNLAVNSRDAMPNGGKLVIETSGVRFDSQSAAQSAKIRPGSFVCLSVSDTGAGIAPENLPHIFEPFFTTKDIGKGTGLGLATVFGIVQQHQGWVDVYSEIGHGTTFRVYLPRVEKTLGQEHPVSAPEDVRGGNETILIAEDDAYFRVSMRKALTQLGYRVLEAVNGVEAVEIWKQYRNEIQLLLTDMMMPGGVTGRDLGERLLKENSGLKVIYTSGYSAEVAGKGFPLKEGVNFIAKPFQAAQLAKILRVNLDQ
ncbi:MAG TPA: PAS domain S-box protein [Verrucomicrobiae bacterium]|nr:PAS domain S-box protein [Verrucomicrobiae bacterium]